MERRRKIQESRSDIIETYALYVETIRDAGDKDVARIYMLPK